ncbi:MAG: DNA primase [Finegoldia magna]|uniref:DNA primase n=1 Tax=Finegoldia TaxID=150022 RepID=UPI000B915E01|nr:DNA primase [Finegoldia magna]MDU2897694.1 DNA primase [Finegoldia magna]MDU5368457.1 DNA primase [Finegoldia magna]MDU5444073.1 DNA primase [Finegoldia magna]OXZ25592.1 DNA primase [Finegoldia magna]
MGFIPQDKIDEIKSVADIVSVIGDYVELKRAGSNYVGLCPFHNEKTPSFSVSPSKGIFHCFGCGVGGDVISFIMQKEGLSYPEAIKFLADKLGILVETNEVNKEKYEHRKKLFEINNEAKLFYYKNLLINDIPKDYIKKRNLNNNLINKFIIGYADGKNSLYRHLLQKGYQKDDIIEVGLINQDEKGNVYDKFRNRLMFPIIDIRGNVIGFGGRAIADSRAKYMNSPQSLAYDKSKNVYGVSNLKNSTKVGKIILVEGYMDVISLTNYGFDYAIASLGTSLTHDQAKLIKRYCKNIYICYDGDSAGQKATSRAIEIFKEQDISPNIIVIPDNMDPDDYIKQYGNESFDRLIDNAVDSVIYEYKKILQKYDINDVKEKIQLIDDLTTLLSKLDREVIRDEYIKRFSDDLNIEYLSLKKDVSSKLNEVKPNITFHNERTDDKKITEKDSINNQEKITAVEIMTIACFHKDVYYDLKEEFSKFKTKISSYNNFIEFVDFYYSKNNENQIDEKSARDYFKNDIQMDRTIDYLYQKSRDSININNIGRVVLEIKKYLMTQEKESIKSQLDLMQSVEFNEKINKEYNEILNKILEINRQIKEYK